VISVRIAPWLVCNVQEVHLSPELVFLNKLPKTLNDEMYLFWYFSEVEGAAMKVKD
jgi:hypothetical protein